jgi:hypothetical protein
MDQAEQAGVLCRMRHMTSSRGSGFLLLLPCGHFFAPLRGAIVECILRRISSAYTGRLTYAPSPDISLIGSGICSGGIGNTSWSAVPLSVAAAARAYAHCRDVIGDQYTPAVSVNDRFMERV